MRGGRERVRGLVYRNALFHRGGGGGGNVNGVQLSMQSSMASV